MEKSYFYDGKTYSREEIQQRIEDSLKGEIEPRVAHTLRMLEGKEILDVGCADGELSRLMAQHNHKVHGIDLLESSIEIAREFNSTPNTSYEVRDVLKQPFSENSFDCITFLETMEHVENPAIYLREFHRILRPNGYVILSTPNATSLKNIFYALSYRKKEKRIKIIKEIIDEPQSTGTQLEHIYNWDFPTLIRLLSRCGFSIVEHAFARSGPIIIPILGKKIQIIKYNSNTMKNFESLMTTHVIKARKET